MSRLDDLVADLEQLAEDSHDQIVGIQSRLEDLRKLMLGGEDEQQ